MTEHTPDAATERAAIVAWLSLTANRLNEAQPNKAKHFRMAARCIQAGEHNKEAGR